MRRTAGRSGVTLVEVLLASVVCGAGLAVILSAMSTSIRLEVNADLKVKAARFVELQLGRIESGALPLESAAGDFTEEGAPEFTWTVEVTEADQSNLSQVTVSVLWTEQGEPRDLDAVRLIFTDPDSATSLGGSTATAQTQVGSGSQLQGASGAARGSTGASGAQGGASGAQGAQGAQGGGR